MLRPGRLLPLALAGLAAATGLLVTDAGPAGAAGACPSVNRPNMLRVAGGSPQTGQLEKPFQTNLQVELANSNGCPLTGRLAGIWVDFTAPATGASGTFATSGTNHVTVGTDATGVATAPTFTANDTAGSYTVQADSDYGSVDLYLSNTASGVPASITASGVTDQHQSVNSQYSQPLEAQVADANGRPVQGITVTFSLGTGATGAGASFLGGGAQASETTNANGQAISPLFVANDKAGRFIATASITANVSAASYSLQNVAGPPASMTAGAASGEATPVGTHFPIPLAVTVTDADENPVAGLLVTFTVPARGPSGHFGGAHARRTARVRTNSKGIAIAPALTANDKPGGYVATASASGVHAAFALINQPRR